MSILTELLEKKITFSQAAQKAAGWAQAIVAHDPTLSGTANAVLSDVKQGASNAVDIADSALSASIMPAAKGVESLLENALSAATKGVTVPFNPLISDGIDRIADAIKAEADAWALKAKATLATPQSPSASSNSISQPAANYPNSGLQNSANTASQSTSTPPTAGQK